MYSPEIRNAAVKVYGFIASLRILAPLVRTASLTLCRLISFRHMNRGDSWCHRKSVDKNIDIGILFLRARLRALLACGMFNLLIFGVLDAFVSGQLMGAIFRVTGLSKQIRNVVSRRWPHKCMMKLHWTLDTA